MFLITITEYLTQTKLLKKKITSVGPVGLVFGDKLLAEIPRWQRAYHDEIRGLCVHAHEYACECTLTSVTLPMKQLVLSWELCLK